MHKRMEAVERRLEDIEKSISELRTLLMNGRTNDGGPDLTRRVARPRSVGSTRVQHASAALERDVQETDTQVAVVAHETRSTHETGAAHEIRVTQETDAAQEAGAAQEIGATREISAAQEMGAVANGTNARALKGETPGLLHNSLGEPYSIKLVYPAFFRSLDVGIPYCTISFPAGKERLARQVREGTLFFIYVTSPVRKVIGLAQALGPAEFRGDVTPARPWVVPMEWVIGPKAGGVSMAEVGLEVRARPGDSVYAIPTNAAVRLMEALRPLPDLDEAEVDRLRSRFETDTSQTAAGRGALYSISSNSMSSMG